MSDEGQPPDQGDSSADERPVDSCNAEIDELRSRLSDAERERDEARANYGRLRKRKIVQAALAAVGPVAAARRGLKRVGASIGDALPRRALLERRLRAERTTAAAQSSTLVSIVIPTRDGASDLRTLFAALVSRTIHEHIEIIVVDNASSDDTDEVVASFDAWPIRTIRNDVNESFATACNQGAAAAAGDAILFLNNDTEPISAGWLAQMLAALEEPDTAAVGALLVYPDGRNTSDPSQRPLTVQHRGIGFGWRDGRPQPINLGVGEVPVGLAGKPVEVPAATAACLLVSRADFESVDGFTNGYQYGWEDTDLCMKLRDIGRRVVVAPNAVLFHHEFGTQDRLAQETKTTNYVNNSRRFTERWGGRVGRLLQREMIERSEFWAAASTKTIALTVTDLRESEGYGDWYTAHELGDALEAIGWKTTYIEHRDDAWHREDVAADIVISLLPQYDPRLAPSGAMTVAWVRNWVDRWLANAGFDDYTMVAASTDGFVSAIEYGSMQSPVLLPLATNAERFRSGSPSGDYETDVSITANRWGADRSVAQVLEGAGVRFAVYGKGWEDSENEAWCRGPIGYEQLPSVYASSTLVVDDTVQPNMPALNSRVFDALAARTLVLSDNPAGSSEWFDGLLPTWTTPDELLSLIDRYTTDSADRESLTKTLAEIVVERHTYTHRARQFLEALSAAIEAPRVGLRISAPNPSYAESWGDTHFARDAARSLRRHGFRTLLSLFEEWQAPAHTTPDVIMALRGLHAGSAVPGAINLLWVISHPDDVTPAELSAYDLVYVAGEALVARFEAHCRTKPKLLLQATDPQRFAPGPGRPNLATELLFVGNSRGVDRSAVRHAIQGGFRLAVYGVGWSDRIPDHYVVNEGFPNDRLPELYRSAQVVLNDHWPAMARAGIVSNRLFDAVAAGAVVVSDEIEGLGRLFGSSVSMYSDQETFESAVVEALKGADSAADSGDGVRVRSDHSFDARSTVLVSDISNLSTSGLGMPTWPTGS